MASRTSVVSVGRPMYLGCQETPRAFRTALYMLLMLLLLDIKMARVAGEIEAVGGWSQTAEVLAVLRDADIETVGGWGQTTEVLSVSRGT